MQKDHLINIKDQTIDQLQRHIESLTAHCNHWVSREIKPFTLQYTVGVPAQPPDQQPPIATPPITNNQTTTTTSTTTIPVNPVVVPPPQTPVFQPAPVTSLTPNVPQNGTSNVRIEASELQQVVVNPPELEQMDTVLEVPPPPVQEIKEVEATQPQQPPEPLNLSV